MSEELSLVWYNLERVFQELQIKFEMVESSIETLQEYRKSIEKDMNLLKSNLNSLVGLYGAVDAERSIKEQSRQEV
jgi:chaperonin cofactor prefoldin